MRSLYQFVLLSRLSKQKILMEFSMLELEGTIQRPNGPGHSLSFVKLDSLVGSFEPSQPQSFGKGALREKDDDSNR